MMIDKITYVESGNDLSGNYIVSYFVDNEKASKEEFKSAWNQWDEKSGAEWHDFTNGNIEKMFS